MAIGPEGAVKEIVAATCTAWLADTNADAVALMFADPKLTPLTVGCVAGVVAPAAMVTVGDEIVRIDVFVLLSETVVPPEGAGTGRVTGNGTDWFGPTVTFAGRMMVPRFATVTLTVVLPTPVPLAVIVAPPGVTPVTGTSTVVALAAKATVAGTVAFADEELRLMVSPVAGACAERFSVRF